MVRRVLEDHEIVEVVIHLIAVAMMHNLLGHQQSPKPVFAEDAVQGVEAVCVGLRVRRTGATLTIAARPARRQDSKHAER